jgi:hypothetical protein
MDQAVSSIQNKAMAQRNKRSLKIVPTKAAVMTAPIKMAV